MSCVLCGTEVSELVPPESRLWLDALLSALSDPSDAAHVAARIRVQRRIRRVQVRVRSHVRRQRGQRGRQQVGAAVRPEPSSKFKMQKLTIFMPCIYCKVQYIPRGENVSVLSASVRPDVFISGGFFFSLASSTASGCQCHCRARHNQEVQIHSITYICSLPTSVYNLIAKDDSALSFVQFQTTAALHDCVSLN